MSLPGVNNFGREYQRNKKAELYQHICAVVNKELEMSVQEEIEEPLVCEFGVEVYDKWKEEDENSRFTVKLTVAYDYRWKKLHREDNMTSGVDTDSLWDSIIDISLPQ